MEPLVPEAEADPVGMVETHLRWVLTVMVAWVAMAAMRAQAVTGQTEQTEMPCKRRVATAEMAEPAGRLVLAALAG